MGTYKVASWWMLTLAASTFGQDAFESRYVPAGDEPLRIVAGDVDGNGLLDLVTSHHDGSTSVQLAQPGGSYDAPLTILGLVWERRIALADLDGDGALDLLSTGHTSLNDDKLAVRLGGGDGTFGAATFSIVKKSPIELAVGDLDDDGLLDVVVIGDDPRASVLYGSGGGSLEPEVQVPTGGDIPSALELADLDGDGRLDLVFGDVVEDHVTVRLNGGGRTFGNPVTSLIAVTPRDFAFGHFDDDGVLDIAVGFTIGFGSTPGELLVALGVGDGSFSAATEIDVPSYPERVVAADIDEDGDDDLVIPASKGPQLTVLLCDGLGGFAPPRSFGIGASARDLLVAHLDEDGDLDVAVIDYQLDRTIVLRGRGDGSFDGDWTGTNASDLIFRDLDGDGIPDRLSATSASIELALGLGDGRFDAPAAVVGAGAQTFLLGDFDGDGVDDLVSRGTSFDPTLRLQLGLGDGTFGAASTVAIASSLKDLAGADVDNDGNLDVVVLDNNGGSVRMRMGDGLGGLIEGWAQSTGFLGQVTELAIADLDANGKVDYVTSNSLGPARLARGNGNGSFQPPTAIAGTTASSSIALADLDGDGDADLVSVDYQADTLSTQLNDGNANFALPSSSPGGVDPGTRLITTDVDGDGLLDVAFTFFGYGQGGLQTTLFVHRGLGDGSLVPLWSGEVVGPLLAAADVDGDGAVDLHTTGSEQFELLRNRLGPWNVLGAALDGEAGLPKLRGFGPLTAGSDYALVLDDAAPVTLTSLFLGLSLLGAPFKGGTLVPTPDVFLSPIFTDAEGRWALSGVWPVGAPSDFSLYWQAWILDPHGVSGLAASNGLEMRVP